MTPRIAPWTCSRTTSPTVEASPRVPAGRAWLDRAAVPGRAAGARRTAGRDPRGRRAPDPAEPHTLAAPGLLRVLLDQRLGSGDPGRAAHCGARPEPDAVADVARGHRAGECGRRLASPGAGPAGHRSTACITDTASTATLIALAAARETGGLDAAAGGLAGRDVRAPGASTPPSRRTARSRRRA